MSDTAVVRVLLALVLGLTCATGLVAAEPASAARHRETESLSLVLAWKAKVPIRRAPGGRTLAVAGWKTSFGSVRRLQVIGRRGNWFAVESDVLGNGVVGWVLRTAAVRLRREHHTVEVDLSSRRLTLRKDGRIVFHRRVSIGAANSPTPTGRFHLTDQISGRQWRLGCCIVVLSGRQPRLPAGWQGGDRLAVHGRPSRAETIGAPASAGCLHATEQTLRMLSRLPRGTPVVIHP